MIGWLFGLWYGRMRRLDLEILWPTCKREAVDVDHAKALFAVHAFDDPAWLILGEERIIEAIEALT